MADFDENRVTDETAAAAVSHTTSQTVDKLTSTLTNVNIQDGKETPVKKTFQQVKPVAKPVTPKNNFSKKATKCGYDEDDDYGDFDDYDDYDYDN